MNHRDLPLFRAQPTPSLLIGVASQPPGEHSEAVARERLPWVRRPVTGRITTKMPYDGGGNRRWLHQHLGPRIRPELLPPGVWAIARPHLRHLVGGLADRFGRVDVFLEFRQSERCDTRCRDAHGDDCTCSCLGTNHGGAAYWMNWREVGETTLVAGGAILRRHLVVRPC